MTQFMESTQRLLFRGATHFLKESLVVVHSTVLTKPHLFLLFLSFQMVLKHLQFVHLKTIRTLYWMTLYTLSSLIGMAKTLKIAVVLVITCYILEMLYIVIPKLSAICEQRSLLENKLAGPALFCFPLIFFFLFFCKWNISCLVITVS